MSSKSFLNVISKLMVLTALSLFTFSAQAVKVTAICSCTPNDPGDSSPAQCAQATIDSEDSGTKATVVNGNISPMSLVVKRAQGDCSKAYTKYRRNWSIHSCLTFTGNNMPSTRILPDGCGIRR